MTMVSIWCFPQIPSEKLQRAGKVLRNAILSRAPHMIRDRKYHLKTYRWLSTIPAPCRRVLNQSRWILLFISVHCVLFVLQAVLRWHRAGGLVGAAERLCSHTVPCCWDVAGPTGGRGAKPWWPQKLCLYVIAELFSKAGFTKQESSPNLEILPLLEVKLVLWTFKGQNCKQYKFLTNFSWNFCCRV